MSTKRKAEDVIVEGDVKQTKLENTEKTEVKGDENGAAASPNDHGEKPNTENDATESNKTEVEPPIPPQTDVPPVRREGGTFLIAGCTNWDLTGRKTAPKNAGKVGPASGRNLWSPHRFAPLAGVRVKLVASGCNAAHNIIVTEEGQALALGRNEKGQLGLGDTVRRDIPTPIEAVKNLNVVGAACGRNHTLLLTDTGAVFAAGDNKLGQCGVGNQHPVIATATVLSYKGPPVVKVCCGGEFSVVLDCKGVLHSFGCPEYGQLGHNTDGKYFVTSNKLGFHCETSPKRIVFYVEKAKDGHVTPVEVLEITDFSCGSNHTVAVDSKKRAFSWGWGGLGRLGHAEQKDELVPRLIKFFDSQSRGVRSVHCGSSYSLAVNELGCVYLFGQTKRTGEANMYPKPVQDLTGWTVRSVGCSVTSIVMAADESVIAWGPSPTYGELGLGELRKSSTTPMEVKALEGVYVKQVSCGMGHTMFIARNDSEQDEARLAKLPEYSP
ncbi:protein RCC2 homolog [Schistocerca americana]|uniref:protein RCC2 homolog n=1 Tax=Schistocerca americana TaxID=7009 RepID=UPI001F4F9DE3|nr:protein RCC2 homolog [Schistocerca americana]XP_047101172.1 protein RCC2 homolog isoform X1 [Schistocerca piceifrons]XP_049944522.1 protein RCC2 homolog [Schistocerca serialis cubense]